MIVCAQHLVTESKTGKITRSFNCGYKMQNMALRFYFSLTDKYINSHKNSDFDKISIEKYILRAPLKDSMQNNAGTDSLWTYRVQIRLVRMTFCHQCRKIVSVTSLTKKQLSFSPIRFQCL